MEQKREGEIRTLRTALKPYGYGLKRRGGFYITYPQATAGSIGYHPNRAAVVHYLEQVQCNRAHQEF